MTRYILDSYNEEDYNKILAYAKEQGIKLNERSVIYDFEDTKEYNDDPFEEYGIKLRYIEEHPTTIIKHVERYSCNHINVVVHFFLTEVSDLKKALAKNFSYSELMMRYKYFMYSFSRNDKEYDFHIVDFVFHSFYEDPDITDQCKYSSHYPLLDYYHHVNDIKGSGLKTAHEDPDSRILHLLIFPHIFAWVPLQKLSDDGSVLKRYFDLARSISNSTIELDGHRNLRSYFGSSFEYTHEWNSGERYKEKVLNYLKYSDWDDKYHPIETCLISVMMHIGKSTREFNEFTSMLSSYIEDSRDFYLEYAVQIGYPDFPKNIQTLIYGLLEGYPDMNSYEIMYLLLDADRLYIYISWKVFANRDPKWIENHIFNPFKKLGLTVPPIRILENDPKAETDKYKVKCDYILP